MNIWVSDKRDITAVPKGRDSTKPTAILKPPDRTYFKVGDFYIGWEDLTAQDFLIDNNMSRMQS